MPKPKAYRAIGFPLGDPEQITQTLRSVLKRIKIEAEIRIRAIAPRADEQDEFTAVFIFVDGTSRQCEGSYQTSISRNGSLSNPEYISIDSHFRGMTILHQPTEGAVIDFLAIPGLGGGHAYGSFQDSESEFMWLLDRLPRDQPRFRIMTYGYDTTIPDSDSVQDLENLATAFRTSLVTVRVRSTIPLVYLVHSLGGLVAKQAMVHMEESADPVEKDNFNATYAMLFFGVPNTGMEIDGIRAMFDHQPNENLIISLATGSQLLRELHRKFTDKFNFLDARIVCFFETKMTSSSVLDPEKKKWSNTGKKILVVRQDSATHGLPGKSNACDIHGLDSDHRNMVRCAHGDDFYSSIRFHLRPIAQHAPGAIEERLKRIGKNTIDIRTSVGLTPKQKRVLNSLNQPPYTSFRNSSKLVKPEKGTLKWLVQQNNADRKLERESENTAEQTLRMEDFISWRDSNELKILLITAPPGRGKSVLSNFVLEHLESRMQQEPSPSSKIIYYFCNIKNDEASRNANSILRALIVQLCEHQQRLYQNLLMEYETNSNCFFSAPFATLWHIFETMLQDETYTRIYCVIDGLNIYQEEITELIIQLINSFNLGIRAKGPILKLLCTTRPQTSIMALWEPSMCKILGCSQHDLGIFIESRIRSLSKSFKDDMRQFIKEQLHARAENTFLWLEVVIRRIELIDVPTHRKIENAIKNSPNELNELYSILIRDLIQKDKNNARLLVWVVYARRPLDLRALEDAMAINSAEKYINYEQCNKDKPHLIREDFLNIFGTVLDIAEDKVYCIHQSFKDYIEGQKPLQYILPEPRLVLAHASMAYLSLEDFKRPLSEIDIRQQNFPLFDYAANYWYHHIETTADIISSDLLQDFLKEIVSPNNLKARLWMREGSRREGTRRDGSRRAPPIRDVSMMHSIGFPHRISGVAIHFDIGWLAELLLNRELCDISDDFEKDCLSEVVEYEGVVLEVLLKHERGLVLSVTGKLVEVRASDHHYRMMRLLLDRRGADVQITEKVLKAAAGNKNSGTEMLRLLLDRRGADVQITEKVVEAAAGNMTGGKEVMTLLLDRRGADVQITEKVLKAAAGNMTGGKEVMTLLLDRRGAIIQITQKVIEAAVGNKDSGKEVMKLLLDRRGVDVQIAERLVIFMGDILGRFQHIYWGRSSRSSRRERG